LGGVAYARRRVAVNVLRWHSTEFGRRSECERFHIVSARGGWEVLDAEWNLLGEVATIGAGQQLAERLVARAAALDQRLERARQQSEKG
jgi:hypothetical protein